MTPIYSLNSENVADSGAYAGEKAVSCGKLNSLSRLPSATLSAEEARLIRKKHNFSEEQFALDVTSQVEGIYCQNIESYSTNDAFHENFNCATLGEWGWGILSGRYFGHRFFEARCYDFKKDMEPNLSPEHREPGEIAEWYRSIRGGAGFAIGMAAVDRAAKKITGWSPIEGAFRAIAGVFKNGKGAGAGPGTIALIVGVAIFAAAKDVHAYPMYKGARFWTDDQYAKRMSFARCLEDSLGTVVDAMAESIE